MWGCDVRRGEEEEEEEEQEEQEEEEEEEEKRRIRRLFTWYLHVLNDTETSLFTNILFCR